MRRFPPPLRFTLPGLLLLIGLVSQLLLLRAELSDAREGVYEDSSQDTRVLGMFAAAELSNDLRNQRTADVQDQVTHLGAHPEIRAAHVLDQNGQILYSTDVTVPGSEIDPIGPAARAFLKHGGPSGQILGTARNGTSLVGAFAVELATEKTFGAPERGTLVIERDLTSALAKARSDAIHWSLLEGAGILVLVAVLYLALRLLMLRRLSVVRATARSIASGDHEARTRLSGSDEIADLGRDLDRMAVALAERAALERAFHDSQRLESLGLLTGGVAHDFNNLLAVVQLASSALGDALPADHPDRELADDIQTACVRGSDLTRQLLQYARRDASIHERFDIVARLRQVESMLGRLLPDDVELDVHASVSEAWVQGNPSNIEQAVVNLVVNARDAMPRGGRIDVGLRCEDRGGARFIALEVRDSGEGIPEELQERIFEPFFTTKPQNKGTGLGLASLYGIVRQHGGEVTVESTVGEGSTFTLWLPRREGDGETTPETGSPKPRKPTGARILLVEDDERVRRALASAMRRAGWKVHAVGTVAAAIETIRDRPDAFDLVLSDIGLPDRSGIELYDEMASCGESLPFLLISGHADGRGARAQLEKRGIPLLEKPFAPETLIDRVSAVLAKRASASARRGVS